MVYRELCQRCLLSHSIRALKMMPAASGGKYQEQKLFEKISFSMTDITAHKLRVLEMIGEELT